MLATDPAGGSGSYAVIDFRPVFITDEADSATAGVSAPGDEANGIVMAKNGKSIEKIRVRAINPAALPDFSADDGDETIDYVGVGTKIVRLVE